MKYKISIIIPVYNTEKYISRCLESIFSQTFNDYEIIIVDDGSIDNSKNVIQDIINDNSDKAIKYFYQENAGQATARNFAIKNSSGKYICFIDSDDYIDNTMLQTLYEISEKENSDIVVCDSKLVYEDSKVVLTNNFSDWCNDNTKNYMISNAGPCAKLIKADIIKKNDLYFPEGIIYEDLAVVPAYGIYAKKISYIQEPFYNYFQRVNSTMNQSVYNKKLEDIFTALKYLKTLFEKSGTMKEYSVELEYIYIEHLLHAASLRFLEFEEGKENIRKIINTIKNEYGNYRKNIYFRKCSFKYKFVCDLFYRNKLKILKILLRK